MAKYAATLARTASTTASLGTVGCSATLRRLRLVDIVVGSEGTPADNPFLYLAQRYTVAGTSTAVTPKPYDFADVACSAAAGQNHTIEPTYTANEIMLRLALNQRASFRWVAAPGEEIVIPATSASGVGFQTPTSSAVAISATVIFDE